MTRRIGRMVVIQGQPDERCQLCGQLSECRPYGPRGENVCFDCGMKNEDAAKRAFSALLEDHN